MLKFNTSFEQYTGPCEQFPDKVQFEAGVVAHDELPPEVDTSKSRRRMRLAPPFKNKNPWLHLRVCWVR